MGGRSSGRHFSAERLKELSETAREVLKKADEPQRRCVFISFASEDLDEVNLLRGQAKNEKSGFDLIDRSLQEPFDSERAEYIKQGIRQRISQSSVTLVYVSSDTADSKWVDWEIRESIRLGNGVIGVYKGNAPPGRLPPALQEFKARIIPWTHETMADAIEQASRKRT